MDSNNIIRDFVHDNKLFDLIIDQKMMKLLFDWVLKSFFKLKVQTICVIRDPFIKHFKKCLVFHDTNISIMICVNKDKRILL